MLDTELKPSEMTPEQRVRIFNEALTKFGEINTGIIADGDKSTFDIQGKKVVISKVRTGFVLLVTNWDGTVNQALAYLFSNLGEKSLDQDQQISEQTENAYALSQVSRTDSATGNTITEYNKTLTTPNYPADYWLAYIAPSNLIKD
ncbi:MAG: hypothetical protein R3A13_07100 [Bdellovibrionota bacterium]